MTQQSCDKNHGITTALLLAGCLRRSLLIGRLHAGRGGSQTEIDLEQTVSKTGD